MAIPSPPPAEGQPESDPLGPKVPLWRGLSGKVLVLTILFVLVGEVLIFLPSIANFRITWLKTHIAQAEIAALAVEAAPEGKVSDKLRKELLKGAGARVVALQQDTNRRLVLKDDMDLMIDETFDLRQGRSFNDIVDAFRTLTAGGNRLIRVIDEPPNMSGDLIDIALHERPLREAMLVYARNILILSIILSIIVAILIFLALNRTLVRPMRRLSFAMLRFSERPEDPSRIIVPSARRDELGMAERELRHMQIELASLLQQKSRLAALGLAVSKVSHDLRGMLASAQLISDRLGMVTDPTVQKFAPKLVSSLDRAILFCEQTLKFGRAQEAPPHREKQPLKLLVDEVIEAIAVQASSRVVLYDDVLPDLVIDCDHDHMFRILMNLARNSVQALEQMTADPASPEGVVRVKAWREGATVTVEVKDNGPGVPARAREHLFEAFQGAARPGGTGLGLAIAKELVEAHGGELRLMSETPGAVFWVVIPDRISEVRPGRRGQRTAGREA